jgi:hypothetical protein
MPPSPFEKSFSIPQPFKNPEEELVYLRKQLEEKERLLRENNQEVPRPQLTQELVEVYQQVPQETVLVPALQAPEHETILRTLKLAPEAHDTIVSEIADLVQQKGIKHALEIVQKMNNSHITDDVHRFLVQYIALYHELPGIKPESELYKQINHILFEVTLPEPELGKEKNFKEYSAMMEQMLAGFQALSGSQDKQTFSFEIALSDESDHVIFYVSVPRPKADLFEKQLLGMFHNAKLTEVVDDYNIFPHESAVVGAVGVPMQHQILKIKTYDTFEADPIAVLLNVFSKMKRTGEGAAFQVVIRPGVSESYKQKFGRVLDALKRGERMKEALQELSPVTKELGKVFSSLFSSKKPDEPEKKPEQTQSDQDALANITEKLGSPIVEVTLRIVAASESVSRSQEILDQLIASFHQFADAKGNSIIFRAVSPKNIQSFVRDFSFRAFSSGELMTLNLKELATVFHFPTTGQGSPQLKQSGAVTQPAPLEMGTEGIILGYNVHRGKVTPIHFLPKDRLRHFYTIGQTGVGKTQMFLKMIIQDIQNGDGCCFIDPHGSDINTILANIPPHRIDDVIYFDPTNIARPMGLNMLEFDERSPQQKSLVIGELMALFDKLFDMKAQGGAMFGQYFRNSALLNMEDPSSGNTVLEITRVLANKQFREMKLSKCKNPIITEFWKSAEQTTGDQGLENFVPYISSKFDDFISNEFLRPIILQEKSAFNFRDVIDSRKILIVNLSKGLLGEKNANLIGLIMIMKLQMAAMSRAESLDLEKFPPFYVYLDEFQNVVTDSISAILSEARKYKLSLNMTHQYMEQLPDFIRDAVFGNVGNMGFFRIKSEDAATAEPRIVPRFTKDDIVKQENFNCIASMLIDGKPANAFNMNTIYDGYAPKGNSEMIQQIKELSALKYGRPRQEIEEEIQAKYRMI